MNGSNDMHHEIDHNTESNSPIHTHVRPLLLLFYVYDHENVQEITDG